MTTKRKTPKKGIIFKFDVKLVDVAKDENYSLTKLGGMKIEGTLSPHMAQIISDAITNEGPDKLHPLESIIMDLTDGVKRWEDIKAETGLEDDRCKELYAHVVRIRNLFTP